MATGGALLLVWRWRLVPAYVATSGVIGLGGTWLLARLSGACPAPVRRLSGA